MKKIAFALLVAAGVGSSFSAMAAGVAIPPPGTSIATADCTLLGEPVNINLSKNVQGGYLCNEATTTIKVATCHVAGSRKAKTVQCTMDDSDPAAITYSPTGCAAGVASVEISDYTAFGGTSKGGSLGTYELGGPCTADSVLAVSLFD